MMDLKPGPTSRRNHEAPHLSVRGLGALAEGQLLRVGLGETIVVGRSRHCDWSLRRAPQYLKTERDERDVIENDAQFNSVSRRHASIAYIAPDMVEVRNLSGNGTLVDGRMVDRIVLTDCRESVHRIQLGPRGVILEVGPGSLPVV